MADMESAAEIFDRDVVHQAAEIQDRNYAHMDTEILYREYVDRETGESAFEDYVFPTVD